MPNKTRYIFVGLLLYATVYMFFRQLPRLNSIGVLSELILFFAPLVLAMIYFSRKYISQKTKKGVFWKMPSVGIIFGTLAPLLVLAGCENKLGLYKLGLCQPYRGEADILFLAIAPLVGLVLGFILAVFISSKNRHVINSDFH